MSVLPTRKMIFSSSQNMFSVKHGSDIAAATSVFNLGRVMEKATMNRSLFTKLPSLPFTNALNSPTILIFKNSEFQGYARAGQCFSHSLYEVLGSSLHLRFVSSFPLVLNASLHFILISHAKCGLRRLQNKGPTTERLFDKCCCLVSKFAAKAWALIFVFLTKKLL